MLRYAQHDMIIVFPLIERSITAYTAGLSVSNRFCISAQSLLWLCQVSQSLTLRARGGSSAGRPERCSAGLVQLSDEERRPRFSELYPSLRVADSS